jgi:hypothetical protein
MRDSGQDLAYLRFDEGLTVADLDGSQRMLHETADILYVSTHGSFSGNGYTAMLHNSDWLLDVTRIGIRKAPLAVKGRQPDISIHHGERKSLIGVRGR